MGTGLNRHRDTEGTENPTLGVLGVSGQFLASRLGLARPRIFDPAGRRIALDA